VPSSLETLACVFQPVRVGGGGRRRRCGGHAQTSACIYKSLGRQQCRCEGVGGGRWARGCSRSSNGQAPLERAHKAHPTCSNHSVAVPGGGYWVRLWLRAQRLDVCQDGARLLTANGPADGARQLLEERATATTRPAIGTGTRRE
jgi:hypothetical protein